MKNKKKRKVTLESNKTRRKQRREQWIDRVVWLFALFVVGLAALVVLACAYKAIMGV